MKELIVFILISYGISNIIVFGSIFGKFRNVMGVNEENPKFLGKLFGCMMCLPFWVGVFLSIFFYSPSFDIMDGKYCFLSYFLDGCLASGCVWVIHTIQEKLEA